MTAVIERIGERRINFKWSSEFIECSAKDIELTEEQSTWEDWQIKVWLCKANCVPLVNKELVRLMDICCIGCAKLKIVKNCIEGCQSAKSVWKNYNEVALYSINDINNTEIEEDKVLLGTYKNDTEYNDKLIKIREYTKAELGYRNLCRLFYRNFAEMNLKMIECLETPLRLTADDVMEKAEAMTDLAEFGYGEGWYMSKCNNLKTDYENFAKMRKLIADAKEFRCCGK